MNLTHRGITFLVCMMSTMSSAQQLTDYSCSWVGNSFPGGYTDGKWVQHSLTDMVVTSDGKVITTALGEEGKRRCSIYKDGAVWDNGNGNLNGTLLGVIGGKDCNGEKCISSKVIALHPAEEKVYAVAGRGKSIVKCWHIDNTRTEFEYSLGGLAEGLAAGDTILAISYEGMVHIVHNETASLVNNFSVPDPGQMSIDTDGHLWIICRNEEVRHYTREGDHLKTIAEQDWYPTDVSIDKSNDHVLIIADNGPDQQVKFYDISADDPVLKSTLGHEGGISSGATAGEVTREKLWGLEACGTDSDGNVYVALTVEADFPTIRSYTPDGSTLAWELHGREFCSVADYDPLTGDIYSRYSTYTFDYDSPPDGSHWSLKSHTIDLQKYPNDTRPLTNLGHSVRIRRIQGKRFLFMTGMRAANCLVYRFEDELAVPGAAFGTSRQHFPSAPQGDWIWRDENGNGDFESEEFESVSGIKRFCWLADDEAGVWNAFGSALNRYACEGLDSYGNPIYTVASRDEYDVPAPLNHVMRAHYDNERDIMILSGYSPTHPKSALKYASNKGCGLVYARYNEWSKGNTTSQWEKVWEYNPSSSSFENQLSPRSFDFAGDYLFVCWVSYGPSGTSVLESRGEVTVYSAKTGEKVGYMLPDETIGGPLPVSSRPTISGAQDMSHSLHACQRDNGEYLVIVEENKWAKNAIYRWCPDGNCMQTSAAPAPLSDTRSPGIRVPHLRVGEHRLMLDNLQGCHTVRVRIMDCRGRTVAHTSVHGSDRLTFPLDGYIRGIYIAEVTVGATSIVRRFIIP